MLFIRNVQKRQLHRDRRWISGCLRWVMEEEIRKGEGVLDRMGFLLG
jgi:hypothetical protein